METRQPPERGTLKKRRLEVAPERVRAAELETERRARSGARPDERATSAHPDAATRKAVVDLAWPIAVAMLGDTAMGLVDTKLVAGLGREALGGVGVATMIMWLNYSIVFGVMRGVKVRTAHAVGEGRSQDAVAYAKAGAAIGLLAGLWVALLARDATVVFRALGIDAATIPYARDFLAARTFGAPAICVVSAMVQSRQGLGDSRTPMIAGLLANVVNAVLAWALIYGRFGLPALGVKGAGYGTAIAETLQAIGLVLVVIRNSAGTSARTTRTTRQALGEVATLGVPTGLQFGLEMLAFTAFTAILGGIGAHEVAAHQIAMAVIRTSFLPGVAVAEAASVLVGKSLGKRDLAEADRITRTSIVLATAFMGFCALVFALFGRSVAGFFTRDPLVFDVTRRLLLVAAIFQIMDAVAIVLRGALRAAKDVRVVALIGISCAWIFVTGAAWLFGRTLGLGAVGGWLGFIVETSVAAALYWWRWTRGGWRVGYPRPAAALAVA
jgi:MATE family multidrug resistance protein